ncbi:RidA family protein [Taibaiella lutea]|uniref:RidA family protein n=1 Tax=Taibaiella lutea TaxID=2608001 RepID=A0A5M6CJM4_9BACT|nr:RidA family protein [Taibaiella lutea]KAA5533555.1 RidA family protein [Taibaiella lutea]
MSHIEDKLNKLGLQLKMPKAPVGQYLDCKRVGELLFVSGRVSELTGMVGADVTIEEAKEAARDTVLLILSILKKNIELDTIAGVVKLQGFIRSDAGFTKQPQVLDGASELLIELFGEDGRHARTATGVNQLPFGAVIQLDMVLNLK